MRECYLCSAKTWAPTRDEDGRVVCDVCIKLHLVDNDFDEDVPTLRIAVSQ